MSSHTLASQDAFSFLSVPDLRPVTCPQDPMELDAVSRSASSDSQKAANPDPYANVLDCSTYVPVNYISPEVYALLAAAEASVALREDVLDYQAMEIDMNGLTLDIVWDGVNDPERALPSMAPPKRFYRTFWQSVSLRLLHQHSTMAWTSPMSGPPKIGKQSA